MTRNNILSQFDSVAESCFVVPKTTSKTTSKSHTSRSHKTLFQSQYNNQEHDELVQRRTQKYKDAVKHVENVVDNLMLELNSKLISSLSSFVESAYSSSSSSISSGNTSHTAHASHTTLDTLPTALIYSGINTLDNRPIFTHLKSSLSNTHYVASLQSRECTTLKNLIKSMISQFVGASDDKDDEKEENIYAQVKRGSKLPLYDIAVLEGWYKHVSSVKQSRKSKAKNGLDTLADINESNKPKLVVFIDDFEGFETQTLSDFIEICSNHSPTLPIVLFISLSTSHALHQLLPRNALSQLSMTKFQLSKAEDALEQLVEQLVVDSKRASSFKIGASIFSFLRSRVVGWTGSCSDWVNGFKYAMMNHYYADPMSVLLDINYLESPAELENIMKRFSDRHWTTIRNYKSFRAHVEKLVEAVLAKREASESSSESEDTKSNASQEEPAVDIEKLLTSNTYLAQYLPTLLQSCQVSSIRFSAGLEFFHTTYHIATKTHVSKVVVIERCLYHDRADGFKTQINSLVHWIKKFTWRDALRLLDAAMDIFSQQAYKDHFQNDLEKISELKESFVEYLRLDIDGSEIEVEPLASEEEIDYRREGRRRGWNASERKTMNSSKSDAVDMLSITDPYYSLTTRLANLVSELFRSTLVDYKSIPLHEIFYYDRVRNLQRAFVPPMRSCIQTALEQGYSYGYGTKPEHEGDIHSDDHDTAILYKLHLECGKMINLYDWFVAFQTIVGGSTVGEDAEDSATTLDASEDESSDERKSIQARFVKAVSELQVMGFVKETKRKTDHVQRLTWGRVVA